MTFTSFHYLIFLVLSSCIFFLLPKKLKNIWLLLCSYYFYMSWNAEHAILMFVSTIVTYIFGLAISRNEKKNVRLLFLILTLIINIGILAVFKYYVLIADFINIILNPISLSIPKSLNLLLPVGISFYTFRSLSYIIDVYRKDVLAEKNIIDYALFVSFFPELIAGPIEKSKNSLSVFKSVKKISYTNLCYGSFLILIGFFFKLVISDRASIMVDFVYNNLNNYVNGGGIYLILASLLFTIQIYFDFYSYSIIARGSGYIMGYDLTINFKRPYLASSIKDFWRRWHISLSTWFRDYLYFPLGGNRKGFLRTQINILIVFLVSGLWHGASLNFIIWGGIHGVFQIIENIVNHNKKEKKDFWLIHIIKVLITFIIINFAWIFFRSNSIQDSITILKHLFDFGMVIDVSMLGTNYLELIILAISVFIVFIVEFIAEKKDLKVFFYNLNIIFRWIIYFTLLFGTIIFGIYGPGFNVKEFIYLQF